MHERSTSGQTSLQETQAQGERQLRLLSIALEQTQDPRYREGVLRLLGSVTPESDPLHTWASEEVSRYEDDRSRQAELDELAAQMEDKDAELQALLQEDAAEDAERAAEAQRLREDIERLSRQAVDVSGTSERPRRPVLALMPLESINSTGESVPPVVESQRQR